MRKKQLRFVFCVYATLFLAILIGFFAINFYCKISSSKLYTYSFTSENLTVPQDGIVLRVQISKEWIDNTLHPNNQYGAQYDGVLSNNSDYMFKDWSAKMTFSDNLYVDSSWNGLFSSEGNQLSFIAQGEPATVQERNYATFGAVMYANEAMILKNYSITGYRILKPSGLFFFKFLLICSVLWFFSLLLHLGLEIRTRKYRRQQELDSKMVIQSMNTFTGFIDAKDTYTKGHSVRVAEYATEIARRMKLDSLFVSQIYYISLMHDCGKIGIPDTFLQKPGKLTEEEYKVVQSHTIIGDGILINFTAIPGIRDGAHYHHERYDGKGYPSGLKGADIPLCARIICVADSFDAMNSSRCYRKVLDQSLITQELLNNSGKQFDPEIVPIMISMMKDGFVYSVMTKYPNNISYS